MKICLITPRNPESFWTFDRILPSLGKRCVFPNLALPTPEQSLLRFIRSGKEAIWRRDDDQTILEAAQLSGRDVEILCGSGDGSAVERHTIGELIPFGLPL